MAGMFDAKNKGAGRFNRFVAWITLLVFLVQPTLAAAQAVADPNAANQNRPTVTSAPNGVPVVQITAPTAAGVSRNLYTSFDVNAQGLILNNSRDLVKTQLAGFIEANPNLRGAAASKILNEVTGGNISHLRGYIEVAGQRAEVIIANPNGIVGNGFGFINTSRAVLTTGIPVFGGSGSLDAFRVTSGQIAIEGTGMDASTADRADLISRAVSVNAGIWAKELNVVAGANEVNANTLGTSKIAGDGAQPALAIDVSNLGGMYANKIRLVGTENGVGVVSRGTLSASGGDLTLTNDGQVTMAGSASATGNIAVSATDVTHQGTTYAQNNTTITATGTLNNSGVLAAAQNTTINAQTVSSTGTIGAGIQSDGTVGTAGDLTITAGGAVTIKGQNLAGGNLSATGASIDSSGATTYSRGAATLTATAGDIDNTGGSLTVDGALSATASGTVKNDKDANGTAGAIKANKVTVTAGAVSNKGGNITQLGADNTTLTATGTIDNTGGKIASNAIDMSLKAGSVVNDQGQIQHAGTGTLKIEATTDLNNAKGTIATNGQANLTAVNIDNSQGTAVAQKRVDVAATNVTNNQGVIAGPDVVHIAATGAVDNRQGVIQAGKGVDLSAQSLNNNGGSVITLDTSETKVTVSQDIQNQSGLIGGNGDVSVAARGITNTDGRVTAQGVLTLSASQEVVNTRGALAAGQNLTFSQKTASIDNSQGRIEAGNELTVKAAAVNNAGGKLAADQTANLDVNGFSGAGEVSAGQDIVLNVTGAFTNDTGNKIKANGNLTVNSSGTVTNRGNIEADDNLSVTGSAVTNEATGLMAANQTVNITASGDISNAGSIFSHAITLQGNRILNTGDTAVIANTGNMKLYAANALENKDGATIYSTGNIDIAGSAAKDDDGNYTTKTGTVLNQSADIEAGGDIVVSAGTVTNKMGSYTFTDTTVSSTRYDQRGLTGGGNLYAVDAYIFALSTVPRVDGGGGRDVPSLWLISQTVTDRTVTATSPAARMIAGRNMRLDANTVNNENSQMMAAGTFSTTPGATVNNISVGNQRVSTRTLLHADTLWEYHWSDGDVQVGGYGPHYDPNIGYRFSYINGSQLHIGTIYDDNVVTQLTGGLSSTMGGSLVVNIQGATVNNVVVAPGSVTNTPQALLPSASTGQVSRPQTTGGTNITLPTNGMFSVNTSPTAKYLVETNPRFASFQVYISSDYMLNKLGLDPTASLKRLGDGFYEQKLVREQITELTGRVYLSGYGSAEQQYAALLDNGAYYAQQFGLTVGVGLTPEQMASLTSDMVWMVEQEVQGQKVLVPVVYLAKVRTGDLKADGSVIAADNVQVKTAGDLTNAGVIKATDSVKVEAVNIANAGGAIEAGNSVNLTAVQDIANLSGTIKGEQVDLTAGRDVKIETATSTSTLPFMSRTTTGNTATVSAGQNLNVQAGGDVSVAGAKLSAGQDVNVNAGGSLTVDSARQQERVAVGYYVKDNVVNTVTSIQSGGDTNLVAQRDATLRGAQVSAGNEANVVAGGNVTVAAVKDSALSDVTYGSRSWNYDRVMTNDESVIGSNLTAKNNVNVSSGGSVLIEGSRAASDTGRVAVSAVDDVTVKEATEKHESLTESRRISSGFLSTKVTETRDYASVDLVAGSTLSGEKVDVQAGKDLTVRGSNVVGTGDVSLTAGNDVKITTAQENSQEEHYRYEKTTGIFGSGVGITIGSKSEKNTLDGQAVIQVGSTVASLDGKVTVAAGKDAGITGSIVTSARGIDVTGQNVSIDSATNTFTSTQTYEFKQSGLSVSLGGGIVATGMNLAYDVRRAGQVSDDRLAALYGYKAFEEFKNLTKYSDDWKSGVAISVSLGSQRSSWEAVSTAASAQGSTVASAGNVNITATGSGATDAAGKAADGSVNVVGSGVSGENVTLTAAKDVNLVAADNATTTTNTSSSSSAGVGVQIGPKGGVFVQGSKASGNENGAGTTHTETVVAANDTLTVKTGSDANIVGAQAKGDTVKMEIGGDFNIASQQDTDSYNERTSSAGGTIGFGMPSSISASKGKIDSDYRSVHEQSGLYAGQGGFDIAVGGNTDLKGAVIASEATADKNKLSTGTLTWSDIQNKAEYSASSSGLSLSSELYKNGGFNYKDNTGYGASTDGSASGVTRSAVAPGTIEVRKPENQTQDVNGLSRDTKDTNGSISPIFDKTKVQEELEFQKVLTEVFKDELYKTSANNGSKNFSVDLSKVSDGKVIAKSDDGTEIVIDIKAIAAATGDKLVDVAEFVKNNLDQFTFAANGTAIIVVSGILFNVNLVNGKYVVTSGRAGNAIARTIDPNKLNHIFGKAEHNLGEFLAKHGGDQVTAYISIENAAQQQIIARGITGVFEEVVNVGGHLITVRGNVIEGAVKIGTAFIP